MKTSKVVISIKQWIWPVTFLSIYFLINIIQTVNSNHSLYSFSVFQDYRTVHNNLHHYDINAFLSMIHPALSENKYLYSSNLTPGYSLFLSLSCYFFGLNHLVLKLTSIVYYSGILLALLILVTKIFSKPKAGVILLILSAPGLVLYGSAVDFWVASSMYVLLFSYTLLLEKNEKFLWKSFLVGFIGGLFNFIIGLELILLCMTAIISSKFLNNKLPHINKKRYLAVLLGVTLAILIALIQRNFSSVDDSFLEYIFKRGSKRVGFDPGQYLYVFPRMIEFIKNNYPLVLMIFLSIGAHLTSPPSKNSPKNSFNYEKISFNLLLSHLIFLIILAKTTIFHFFLIYPLMIYGAIFSYIVFMNRRESINKNLLISIICFLSLLTFYEYYRTGFWIPKNESTVDRFLEKMDPKDYLVRDTPFDTWPLQFNAPEKTIFLNPSERRLSLKSLTQREITGYFDTQNTIFHLPEYFGNKKNVYIPVDANCFLITRSTISGFEEIASDRGYFIYKIL